jgi:hypothetical protein
VSRMNRLVSSLRGLQVGHFMAELGLLVAGILIALAVNGWIEDRRDARTEHLYLERLARDLEQDLDVLREFAAFEERQTADALLAYRPLCAGAADADRDRVAAALDHLTTRRTIRLARATYSDLVATGNLRLIRDADLRDRIVKLYESNERWSTIIDRNNQVYIDQMYLQYMLDAGLLNPTPESNLTPMAAPRVEFARRLGVPARARVDRVWTLATESPRELDILCSKLWYRGFVSLQGIDQARTVATQITALRDDIGVRLE